MNYSIDYPDLPVSARREEIIAALKASQVLILCGETGSGKTTQIPKMCLEAGLGDHGLIGCTQPRRIAARSVADRVATELKGPLGGLVGYKVRFTDKVRSDTRIKFMTDGILLAESQGDPMLSAYSCIVIDEAHERSLNIDFILGYLRQLLERRPDLSIIITSATIDAEKFSAHFSNAPVFEVSGRTYPVEIRYRPLQREEGGEKGEMKRGRGDDSDLTKAILDATDELARLGWGDMLIFLPGEREIRDTAEALRKHHPAHTEILPLYARLSIEEQDRIFKPGDARRIVMSTNVAETSLTVPGIRYVIDTGVARVKRYSPRNKVEQLLIEKISQASANQRAGRCGRVEAGVCIRIYDQDDYQNRPSFTDPELLRSSLAGVILRMKSLGLGRVEEFPFIDPPHSRLIQDGYQLLNDLHALDDRGELTDLGRRLAKLPLDPRIARILLAADRLRCLNELLIIASFLSVQDPRERPQDRAGSADEKHKLFQDERSDFMSVLKLWTFSDDAIRHKKSNRQLREHLAEHFLSQRRMREWREVHGQIHTQLVEMGLKPNEKPAGYDAIHQALLTGLLGNIGFRSDDAKARKPGEGAYDGARGIKFGLHPASVLAKKGPKWVVAAELTDTGRLMGRMAGEVRPEWIEEAGRHLLQRNYAEPHWDRKSARVMAFEKASLYGITVVARRRVHYGTIDPVAARELFIRGALVSGDYDCADEWFLHNGRLVEEMRELEHKARKSGVWLDEERMFRVFDARIPADMTNGPALEKWLRADSSRCKTLMLGREDILGESFGPEANLFPESLAVDGVECPLKYRFEPGHPLDGVTLSIPLYLLNRVSEAKIDWLVPGMIRDKVTALMKGLPKDKRRLLIPIPDHVTAFLTEAKPGELKLTDALSAYMHRRFGQEVTLDEWGADIASHLHMNLQVVDDTGQELSSSRDLVKLRQQLGETARLAYGKSEGSSSGFEREGITQWDFGDLPGSVKFNRKGQEHIGHPALLDDGSSVSLLLLDDLPEALRESRRGVVRMLRLALVAQFKQLDKDIARQTSLALKYRALGDADQFFADLLDTIADRALLGDDELPRNEKEFSKQKERAKPRISVVAQGLLRDVETVLDLYNSLMQRLKGKPAYPHAWRDEREHLARLIYPGFIRELPWAQWKDLVRYLKAIERRFEKLPNAGDRDPRYTAAIQALEKRYLARLDKMFKGGVPVDEKTCEFRWQLEELRVSLFAQELKTPYPVSIKRLEKLWESLPA
ncbi:MAG: ATP-dependent RNA helicase HrpA [Thiobacillaceae bacterium]